MGGGGAACVSHGGSGRGGYSQEAASCQGSPLPPSLIPPCIPSPASLPPSSPPSLHHRPPCPPPPHTHHPCREYRKEPELRAAPAPTRHPRLDGPGEGRSGEEAACPLTLSSGPGRGWCWVGEGPARKPPPRSAPGCRGSRTGWGSWMAPPNPCYAPGALPPDLALGPCGRVVRGGGGPRPQTASPVGAGLPRLGHGVGLLEGATGSVLCPRGPAPRPRPRVLWGGGGGWEKPPPQIASPVGARQPQRVPGMGQLAGAAGSVLCPQGAPAGAGNVARSVERAPAHQPTPPSQSSAGRRAPRGSPWVVPAQCTSWEDAAVPSRGAEGDFPQRAPTCDLTTLRGHRRRNKRLLGLLVQVGPPSGTQSKTPSHPARPQDPSRAH